MGLCLTSYAQTTPLETPKETEYPGIISTFEKLIQIDQNKYQKRYDALVKNGLVFNSTGTATNFELEPDFLNSVILHSDPGYLRLASTGKCRFYESILTDLLRSSEGKIRNILMTYADNGVVKSSTVNRKDFLSKIINQECPETQKNVAAFQIKTLDQTLKTLDFSIPSNEVQCKNTHINWLNNPKTPFLCQIHEYTKEARDGLGDIKDLPQRRAMAKIIESKLTLIQKDYIENLCKNLDNENAFCGEFLNVSFWNKIAGGYEPTSYIEDICNPILKSNKPSRAQYLSCLTRIKKENDLCLYPKGGNSGIRPQPNCDQISTALNHSSLKADYKDCPGQSDQMIATNMGRIVNYFSFGGIQIPEGPCSAVSALTTFNFNKSYENDESWQLEACYTDRLNEKEICKKAFIGSAENTPESYTRIVADILKATRGADNALTCQMEDSATYNPMLLKFKSGCYIIYKKEECFISQCKHKVIYNDREIKLVNLKGKVLFDYFPSSIQRERSSQSFLLTNDFKKKGKQLNSLNSMTTFLKKTGDRIIHGVGCAEDLLPTFFKTVAMNQCTPMPFVINGMVQENDKVVFVTRTAADNLEAPRLLSWSVIFSATKNYQGFQPLKLWTLYGLN